MTASTLTFTITCKRDDGSSVGFEVRVETDDVAPFQIHVYVWPACASVEAGEVYYALLERVDGNTIQSVMLMNQLASEYHGLGLSAELILQLALHLKVRIRSSRRASAIGPHVLPSGTTDDRNASAERVWDSLVTRGLAEYSMGEDRYIHSPE